MDNLYQKELLALARTVRALTELPAATHSHSVNNPVCGDKITISVSYKNGAITDRHIAADGCALCAAGAGYWYARSEKADAHQLRALKAEMEAYLKDDSPLVDKNVSSFAPVKALRNRHKCVMLAFEASADLAQILLAETKSD